MKQCIKKVFITFVVLIILNNVQAMQLQQMPNMGQRNRVDPEMQEFYNDYLKKPFLERIGENFYWRDLFNQEQITLRELYDNLVRLNERRSNNLECDYRVVSRIKAIILEQHRDFLVPVNEFPCDELLEHVKQQLYLLFPRYKYNCKLGLHVFGNLKYFNKWLPRFYDLHESTAVDDTHEFSVCEIIGHDENDRNMYTCYEDNTINILHIFNEQDICHKYSFAVNKQLCKVLQPVPPKLLWWPSILKGSAVGILTALGVATGYYFNKPVKDPLVTIRNVQLFFALATGVGSTIAYALHYQAGFKK